MSLCDGLIEPEFIIRELLAASSQYSFIVISWCR